MSCNCFNDRFDMRHRSHCPVGIAEVAKKQRDLASGDIDMGLLEKLANGGGRRTGALRRAGYLTWVITDEGREALNEWKKREANNDND